MWCPSNLQDLGFGPSGRVFFPLLASHFGQPFPGVAASAPPYVLHELLRSTWGNLGKPKSVFSTWDLWLGRPSPCFASCKQNFSWFFFFFPLPRFPFLTVKLTPLFPNPGSASLSCSRTSSEVAAEQRSWEHFLAGRDLENNFNPLLFQSYTRGIFPFCRRIKDHLKWQFWGKNSAKRSIITNIFFP